MSHSANSAPYALILHSSSPELGLGLSNFTDTERYQAWHLGRDLSVYLHTHLQSFILPQTWLDFGWLAVTIGPGSYTGTRMGVVTARTLAQQLELPLFSVSTLAAAAWAASGGVEPGKLVAVELPAQQGHVYGAIYERCPGSTLLQPHYRDQVYSTAAWQEFLAEQVSKSKNPLVFVGTEGGPPYPDAEAICAAALTLAKQVWEKGERPHWSQALPFYGESPVKGG